MRTDVVTYTRVSTFGTTTRKLELARESSFSTTTEKFLPKSTGHRSNSGKVSHTFSSKRLKTDKLSASLNGYICIELCLGQALYCTDEPTKGEKVLSGD